jgi:hypothetical protein
VQSLLQQTPSTHLPDWHSVPIAQFAPFVLRPHEPALQTLPLEHWPVPVPVQLS